MGETRRRASGDDKAIAHGGLSCCAGLPLAGDPDEGISPDDHPVVFGAGSAGDGEAEESEELAAREEDCRGQTARVNAWLLASFRDSLDRLGEGPLEWGRQ